MDVEAVSPDMKDLFERLQRVHGVRNEEHLFGMLQDYEQMRMKAYMRWSFNMYTLSDMSHLESALKSAIKMLPHHAPLIWTYRVCGGLEHYYDVEVLAPIEYTMFIAGRLHTAAMRQEIIGHVFTSLVIVSTEEHNDDVESH